MRGCGVTWDAGCSGDLGDFASFVTHMKQLALVSGFSSADLRMRGSDFGCRKRMSTFSWSTLGTCTMVSTGYMQSLRDFPTLVATVRHGSLGWFPSRWCRCARGEHEETTKVELEKYSLYARRPTSSCSTFHTISWPSASKHNPRHSIGCMLIDVQATNCTFMPTHTTCTRTSPPGSTAAIFRPTSTSLSPTRAATTSAFLSAVRPTLEYSSMSEKRRLTWFIYDATERFAKFKTRK